MKFFRFLSGQVILLLLAGQFIFFTSLSAQTLNWAGSYNGSGNNKPNSILSESNGNFYVTGNFNGNTDWDWGNGQSNLNGNNDVFLSKHNAAGQLLWVRTFGSSGLDEGVEMAFNQAGYLLLAGNFSGTVDFDPSPLDFSLTAGGNQDGFLAWYDTSGNFLNALSFGGTDMTNIRCMTITQNQQILIGGFFIGATDFDPGAATFSLNAQGAGDGFLMALDPFGNFLWADAFGGNDNFSVDEVSGICEHVTGDLFVTGYFAYNIDLDPGPSTVTKISAGAFDFFVSRLSANNNYINGISMGGIGNDLAMDIGSQALGNIIVSGSFENSVEFNPQGSGNNKLSNGMSDAFWLCLDENFNLIWINQVGGTGNDEAGNLWCDILGNVFSGGFFSGSCDFDPGAGLNLKNSQGNYDFFANVFDPFGNTLGAYTIGGGMNDVFYDFAKGPGNSFYYCGTFRDAMDADAGPDSLMLYTPPLTINSFIINLERCLLPDAPLLSSGPFQVCEGSPVLIEILSGDLNDATDWTWYTDSCGGTAFATGLSQFIYPSQSMTIYVRGEGGCVNQAACNGVWVDVWPSPVISLGNDTVICSNDFLALGVATNFSSYQWSTGDTTASILLNAANYPPGLQAITVAVINAQGCMGMDEILVDITLCTGMESTDLVENLRVHPNPGKAMIEIINPTGGPVHVYCADGRLIRDFEKQTNASKIIRTDVSGWKPGLYFLLNEEGKACRFIVQP